jgi:hypothetical protein
MKVERVLPFEFLTAAKYAPKLEAELENAMLRCLATLPKLEGKTVLVLDVSGSMRQPISSKSELDRVDAATSIAMLAREVCERPVIYCTAGSDYSRIHATEQIPARRGFALRQEVQKAMGRLGGGGIFLKQSLDDILKREGTAERVIVFTDEQDCDVKANPAQAPAFGKHNYIVNVSVNKNGIAFNKFTHINGWSESVLQFLHAYEKFAPQN